MLPTFKESITTHALYTNFKFLSYVKDRAIIYTPSTKLDATFTIANKVMKDAHIEEQNDCVCLAHFFFLVCQVDKSCLKREESKLSVYITSMSLLMRLSYRGIVLSWLSPRSLLFSALNTIGKFYYCIAIGN